MTEGLFERRAYPDPDVRLSEIQPKHLEYFSGVFLYEFELKLSQQVVPRLLRVPASYNVFSPPKPRNILSLSQNQDTRT